MRSLLLVTTLLLAGLAHSAPPAPPKVSDLVAVLNSDSTQKAKADACRELARVGNHSAIAALAALLPDEKLSHMARYALETIPGSAVDKALRNSLPKLSGPPLIGVIGSLGVRRDPHAVPLLDKLLRSDNPQVAAAAARALGSIGTSSAAHSLTAALPDVPHDVQLAFCEGLLRCAERLNEHGSKSAALEIYDHLRAMPEATQVRTAALRGAILLRQHEGLPLLLEAIRSDDFTVFASATRIAREMPGTDVTLALARELPQLPPDNQVVLLQFFAQRDDAAALNALFTAAAHHEPAVCVAALNAIASLATCPAIAGPDLTGRVLPVFLNLLFHSNNSIAQAAENGLVALPGRGVDQAVLSMLDSNNQKSHRLKAFALISRRRTTTAFPQALKLAQDADPDLRVASIRVLGELAAPQQLPDLLNLLMTARDPGDLEAAEQSLAAASQRALNLENWADRLATHWDTASPPQKAALVRVFAAMGGTNALRGVRLALTDADPTVRSSSIRALRSWNNGEGASDLLSVARSSSQSAERDLALHSLLELAAQADLPATNRLALCHEIAPLAKTEGEKRLLLAALGALRSTEALELIQPLLNEPALKEEACTAAVNVSERALEGTQGARSAPHVIPIIEKVLDLEPKAALRKRANDLLDQAKSKEHST